jgi:hypothetical protein
MDKSFHRGSAARETYRPFKSTVGLRSEATKEEKNNGQRNHRGYIKKVTSFFF